MGLVDRIKSLFRSKSSLTINVGTPEVFTDIDTDKAIEAFGANTAVYSIVMRDATKFGSIPRYVYDAKETQEKRSKRKIERKAYNQQTLENDLSALLNRPNEYQGQDAFFTELRAYYKVCGECFIWLNRGDVVEEYNSSTGEFVPRSDEAYEAMPVLEMYVLPADKVIVRPDPNNLWGVIGYLLDFGGTYMQLKKSDVIHWKMPNMNFDPVTRTHLRGLAPLTAGAKSLTQHNSATDASVRMYQNDGAKGILTNETLDKLTPEQRAQINAVLSSRINNNDVKGAVAALQGKWAYLALNGSIDMQLLEAKKLTWKELCFLLTVPYTQFDPDTNFANTEWQQKNWVTNTIIPDSKQLDGELNRCLLKAFKLDKIAFIGCDYSELPEMQQDLQKLTTALSTAWWLSPNEKRLMQNEEALPDKIFDELWIPSGITPASQMQDAAEMEKITQHLMNQQLNDGGGDKEKDI